MIQIDCVTLFPEIFAAITDFGITRRALSDGIWKLGLWNPRQFAEDIHRTVDDRPYGGGPGMVMMAETLDRAITAAKSSSSGAVKVIHMTPQGATLNHSRIIELSKRQRMLLLCGRYEGVDERLISRRVDEEISLGDFVMSGGEIAAMAVIDAVVRQLPGVLGHGKSAMEDSFSRNDGLLDCPHYTRPENWRGETVPAVLMSGNHAQIERWRLKQALGRTWLRRPELLEQRGMSSDEVELLSEYREEMKRKEQ